MKRRYRNESPRCLIRLARRGGLRVLAAIAMVCFFMAAGCAKSPPPGPDAQAAARAYLVALKSGDYQTCYRMLAETDLVHGSLGGFLGQIPMAPNVDHRWFAQIERATEYRVDDAAEHDSEATVPVNVTTPDLVAWERRLGARGDSRESVQAKALKQLATNSYPRRNYQDQIVMVRESGEWRLLAGFAQRASIDRLHDQALAAYHDLDYGRALDLYHQMLERLDKAPFTASGELAFRLRREMTRVEAARAGANEAQSYLPRLVLKNVEAKTATSGSPAMFAQIVNSGDRALDQVQVTVSYYTAGGKVVYSERHTPLATPLEFTDFDLPIVPFGPGETREVGIVLKAPPEVQQQNKPLMTVSGVIFAEPSAPSKPGEIKPPAAEGQTRNIQVPPSTAVGPRSKRN